MIVQLSVPLKVDNRGLIQESGLSLTHFNKNHLHVVNDLPCYCLFNYFSYGREFCDYLRRMKFIVEEVSTVELDNDSIIATVLFDNKEHSMLTRKCSDFELLKTMTNYDKVYRSLVFKARSLPDLFEQLLKIC